MRLTEDVTPVPDADRLARLEERVARLEARLAASEPPVPEPVAAHPPAGLAPVFASDVPVEETLEMELGQHWFALGGIAGLTAGVLFLLSLPYPQLPDGTPAVAGFALAAGLVVLARRLHGSAARVAEYVLAAAMALLGFSALRLLARGATGVFQPDGIAAPVVVLATSGCSFALARRSGSRWLTGVSVVLAAAVAVASGSTAAVLLTLSGVTVALIALAWTAPRSPLLILGEVLLPVAYLVWASGNPLRGTGVHFVTAVTIAPVLYAVLLLALAALPLRRDTDADDLFGAAAALLACTFGYGVFLVHSAAVFPQAFPWAQAGYAAAAIGLAAAYFVKRGSRVPTFFHAMTGYAALSCAIIKATGNPAVFVWLGLQSLVVVATAVWFRSRFIVVANFLIFAGIVLGYMGLAGPESGLSVMFGLVALATARILHWQQHRLELKTGLMRNAYLGTAFVLFPYALYHLVPPTYVALAWTALAGAYYVLHLAMQNQKYRWMGHGTLMLATVYAVWAGVSRFEPIYRVLSFLVLGATLLTVSLLLTRSRRRSR